MNRVKQGNRYSSSTRAITQALFQFGGRQVVECMFANLMTPSLRTAKRNRAQFVPFLPGVQPQNFAEVSKILEASKRYHGIVGGVPVILAEDETRIKPRVRWESRRDTQIGFCGQKESHTCRLGLEVKVGSGEEGYSRIVDSFESNVIGSYARVVIVNLLHEKLPRLVISASVTCNSFDATWIREQWDWMKCEWDKHCRAQVGPIIGHASDGDSRRRKLMLSDYCSKFGTRWKLEWEGWMLSGCVASSGDVYGLGDQDPPHNGKKLVNPLDRSTYPLVLGDHHACLEHVHLVYKLYPHDTHSLNFDDVVRRDRENWAGPQRLCSRQVQQCLKMLEDRTDAHQERTMGTRLYLEIVADYIDIFYSVKLDLYSRIVLCGKVSFFFRLWRLWLMRGNHTVSGVTQSLSEKNMVSLECWHDVQMSCHMVVLLCRLFRDNYPGMKVPMHLLGSDCCEHFFSRVGGMSGYERNYDFADLIDCASGLNRLAAMEYGEENLQMGKTHAKQQTIWGKLHPLVAGESEANLSDFTGLRSDAEFVDALKKGLQEAQGLLILLNMAPHTGVRDQTWWKAPWANEKDLGVFAKANDVSTCPADTARDTEAEEYDGGIADLNTIGDLWDLASPLQAGGSDSEEDDGADDLAVVGHEARHVMSEVLQQVCSDEEVTKFDPLVIYDGHSIYKATLVSQLVGNPTLSKDRLTRIKQSIYFNGVKHRPRADGVPVCILDIGSDCAVLFDTENRSRSTRNSREKFTYDHTDLQWIDLESVITVVRMKVEHNVRQIWCLDANDRTRIDEFVQSV
ncbi:hypothetical protein R1sor_021468 [Riccia sorocarpa]|uniref:Uncharacterized protein n=1 Tax=Riccia sorocarpa TaxID=122646 RepID=A0ABD3GH57_9MARC